MPSAKYALALSSLRFSNGKTAIDFSGIAAACDTGLACGLDAAKYNPASERAKTRAMPPTSSAFLFKLLPGALLAFVGPGASRNRSATSVADCGRSNGSFARQEATASSQT